jgi:hypothetical protein
MALTSLVTLCDAQTILNPGTYDALKGEGLLPEGPIVISYGEAPADAHATWLNARGGGSGCGCWIEPDETYTVAMPEIDDGSSDAITLPFSFSLFGNAHTTVFINNNGNLSFSQPNPTYSAIGFPFPTYLLVAPFWADVDTRDTLGLDPEDFLNGQVLYKVTDHALYVNWVEVGHYVRRMDKRNTFQVVITDGTDPVIPGGNNVSFCYGDMQWTTGDASGGVEGFGGVSATVGVNKGDGIHHSQIGRFSADSDFFTGAYGDSSGVHWLDGTHFYLNTAGTNVPPIFGSTFDCDTVVVQMPLQEADDRSNGPYRLIVLPGEQGRQVDLVSEAPTLPNFVNINEDFTDGLEIFFPIDASDAALGFHYITFTATHDGPDPLTSTYVLQVEKVEDISTGVMPTAKPDGMVLQPNPAVEHAVLTWPASAAVRSVTLFAPNGTKAATFYPTAREQGYQFDLGALASGVYLVQAITDNGIWTERLVKTRE